MMGALASALRDEPSGGVFDLALQSLEERLLAQTRRDRIEHLDHDRPWIAAHRAPRPEQAGIKRDRKTRNSHLRIEPRHAILVAGLGAGWPAGAFRQDDARTIARELSPGARVQVRQ